MPISQPEFDALIKEEKEFEDVKTPIKLGPAPISWTRPLKATNSRNSFLVDFYRGGFEISKYTVNKRYQQTIILLRYDNGGRHTNPDDKTFDGPHVHLYREGFHDKFAYPVDKIGIEDSDTMEEVFKKLMQFCNVKRVPNVEIPMF
jgi:hypothetical protein